MRRAAVVLLQGEKPPRHFSKGDLGATVHDGYAGENLQLDFFQSRSSTLAKQASLLVGVVDGTGLPEGSLPGAVLRNFLLADGVQNSCGHSATNQSDTSGRQDDNR